MIRLKTYTDRDLHPLLGRTVAVKTVDRHSTPQVGRLSLKAIKGAIVYVVGSQVFCAEAVLAAHPSMVLPIVVLP